MPKKQRLDLLLVERQLAASREQARRLIMAGEVLVDEQVLDKPGRQVPIDATLRVRTAPPYVSRGGLKLAAALDEFPIDVAGLVAIDVGASTGGFTDCLLQRGAAHVYAVDVGYGQLAWTLRTDPRVIVLERTNIRHLTELPPLPVEQSSTLPVLQSSTLPALAVIDASFIGLHLVLPPTLRLLHSRAQIIALIKPQFEAGKESVGKGGVVRDVRVHRRVLEEMVARVRELELSITGLIASPLVGPAGNVEFLIWLQRGAQGMPINTQHAIAKALDAANKLRQK